MDTNTNTNPKQTCHCEERSDAAISAPAREFTPSPRSQALLGNARVRSSASENRKRSRASLRSTVPKRSLGTSPNSSVLSVRSVPFVLLLLLLTPTAFAADNINVNFYLNHGSAYRDGFWAPLDVYVDNKAYDIKGTLEVRTFNTGGDTQSPIINVPIESPKQSTKRFRLYVFMQQCARVEVQLYNGSRRVLDIPAFMQVTPIRKEDYLCLILDKAPEGYGFLSTQLFKGGKVRFYRESLDSDHLNHLSDRLQCYEPFDLIILGDIEPERIAQHHRELLEKYVERGGTLVVCTGDNAARYKGSWVEALAGAQIGEQRLMKGAELAEQVFSALDADGALQTRETLVPKLETTSDDVLRLGKNQTLATLRKVGNGHVALLAVDADSLILQTCTGYLNLWRDLAKHSLDATPLNFAEGVIFSAATLPRVAGVELAPVSSVITYLALYFIIAIVLNWLFWNWLKRREMAWVCLIFFSIGFTAYAMVFGTQGRARSTELEQIEILRLPANSPIASYTSFTGVLAKGTGTFDGVQQMPNALLYEPKVDQYQYSPYGSSISNNPVTFIQEDPARFEGLRVGASEMRFIVNSDYIELDGNIEGSVEVNKGNLAGTLTNKTGLKLRDALLLANGTFYKLGNGDTWDISKAFPYQQMNIGEKEAYYPGYYDPYSSNVQTLSAYEQQLIRTLLRKYDAQNNRAFIPGDIPPLLIAWATREPYGGFDMNIEANTVLKSVMLVADVESKSSNRLVPKDPNPQTPTSEGVVPWQQ